MEFLRACKRGNFQEVKNYIWNWPEIRLDEDFHTGLWLACEHGHLEIVRYLYEKGANVEALDNAALKKASFNGHYDIVKYLLGKRGVNESAGNNYPVRWASRNGHLKVVKLLVRCGADVSDYQNFAIAWASFNGHIKVVKYLVKKGADPTVGFKSSRGEKRLRKIAKYLSSVIVMTKEYMYKKYQVILLLNRSRIIHKDLIDSRSFN